MARQIVGSVYWIENSRQTTRVVDVQEAFSDPDQAKSQILYAEISGDKKQLILARLAYRQFLGRRYRGENKATPKKAKEVVRQRVPKSPRKKPLRAKSSKKPARRKVAKKRSYNKVSLKSSRREPLKVKLSTYVRRRVQFGP